VLPNKAVDVHSGRLLVDIDCAVYKLLSTSTVPSTNWVAVVQITRLWPSTPRVSPCRIRTPASGCQSSEHSAPAGQAGSELPRCTDARSRAGPAESRYRNPAPGSTDSAPLPDGSCA
jgi:hypothetical protein